MIRVMLLLPCDIGVNDPPSFLPSPSPLSLSRRKEHRSEEAECRVRQAEAEAVHGVRWRFQENSYTTCCYGIHGARREW